MKKKTLYAGLVSLLLLTANLRISTAQIRQRHRDLSIFNNLEMADRTRIIADSSINLSLLKREYRLEKPLWDKALTYLKVTRLDTLAPGRYPIAGDSVFALVTENALKTPETAKWESHRKYIDLHCVIRGTELIQVSPLATATVISPYDENKDLAGYNARGVTHLAVPGKVFVFFSSDVHKPNLQTGTAATDKKIVLKIKASEFH